MGERESPKVRALWNGVTIAESDATVVVEGQHYFPRASVRDEYLRPSRVSADVFQRLYLS